MGHDAAGPGGELGEEFPLGAAEAGFFAADKDSAAFEVDLDAGVSRMERRVVWAVPAAQIVTVRAVPSSSYARPEGMGQQ